ncbi:hypothetical protein DSO57_1006233 [Entomophthora muscae]|uniref:Uncharacterized protein n=1 Tax=Entomophthora muscae TaxID=34485 RepID=A0ACC2RYP1_9FUNG|nr:hypothetical protein DSO57_1006233 [Entomophthora muscae]
MAPAPTTFCPGGSYLLIKTLQDTEPNAQVFNQVLVEEKIEDNIMFLSALTHYIGDDEVTNSQSLLAFLEEEHVL